METRPAGKVTVYYEPGEEEAAELVGTACEQSLGLIGEMWKLEAPADCRVYVMTAWQPFLFHAAPGPWRAYLWVTLPLRRARFQKVWELAGGWALRYGQRRVVGIKPPRLLSEIDAAQRERVFVPREVDEAVRHNVCHELTHVCSDWLHLPAWLREGLAMVTVDRLARRPTVKPETLAAGVSGSPGPRPRQGGYGQVGLDSLLTQAVRGYWITRYLAEKHPALLARQLAHRQPPADLEDALAAGMGMDRDEFWRRIDGLVTSHFEKP